MKYENPKRYTILLRERDVRICPVAALGFYLLAEWWKKDVESTFNDDKWASAMLISEKLGTQADLKNARSQPLVDMTLANNEASPQSFEADNINDINDILNVDDGVHNVIPSFLPGYAMGHDIYMLTAVVRNNKAFRLAREMIIPSRKLQQQLFPFIDMMFPDNKDWKIWINNIMKNRPDDTDRERLRTGDYVRSSYPIIRHLILLVRLRKIILQDFAAMMIFGANAEDGHRLRNVTFVNEMKAKFPVFSTPEFLEFAKSLQTAMVTGSAQPSIHPTFNSTPSNKEDSHLENQLDHSMPPSCPPEDDSSLIEKANSPSTWAHPHPEISSPRASPIAIPITTRPTVSTPHQVEQDDTSDILRQENQALRDKVAALEKTVSQISQLHLSGQKFLSTASTGATVRADHYPTVLENNETAMLMLEIKELREKLTAKEDEKRNIIKEASQAIEEARGAIESDIELDKRLTEIQQSMHGLWAIVAKTEAEKFSTRQNSVEISRTARRDYQALLEIQLEAFKKKLEP
ncbi:hypothetical protein FBU30_003708 [Linnemannia zychae]|nr:hypothetical protein FBU30_003708 [Linnemannia zychae]